MKCPDCNKNRKDFGIRKASKNGFQPACIPCMRERRRIAYEKNKQATFSRIARNEKARKASDPVYRNMINVWKYLKKKNCVPSWVCLEDFRVVYTLAYKKGSRYVVDHKIPISGELVSGLHVPENCQVLTHRQNSRKGNNFKIDFGLSIS